MFDMILNKPLFSAIKTLKVASNQSTVEKFKEKTNNFQMSQKKKQK